MAPSPKKENPQTIVVSNPKAISFLNPNIFLGSSLSSIKRGGYVAGVLALVWGGSVWAKTTMGLGKAVADRAVVAIQKEVEQDGDPENGNPTGVVVTLSGPSSGGVGSPSTNFIISVTGPLSGPVVFTPKDGGDGGAFSPQTVQLSNAVPAGTFTYAAVSSGLKVISVINNGSLTNPTALHFTANNDTPIPPPAPGSDRTSQPYLFQMVRKKYPSTLGGADYQTDFRGPTAVYVDSFSGWKWTNVGGDWIDSVGTPQGNQSYLTFNANSGNLNEFFTYSGINATALVQYVQTNNKWLAVNVRKSDNGFRSVATNWNQTVTVPSISVTYTDATTGTLACKLVGINTTGSTSPSTIGDEINLPVFMEFERPTKPVASATLTISLKKLTSAACAIYMDPCNPPFNTDPVTGQNGLASLAGNLDQGITSVTDVIGAQRYVDGSSQSDFIAANPLSYSSEQWYDPALWGGTQDLTKYPHTVVGKWVAGANTLILVNSAYSGEGFVPLTPGLGAIKITMVDGGIQTGQEGGTGGTAASNAVLYMPYEEMGLLDHIFVRQYVRFGTPHIRVPSDRREVLRNGVPAWTDLGGKFGISPSHNTSYGGFSGTAGGGGGWQMRWSWSDCEANLGGPNEQGIQLGWHLFDYGNNPDPYRYIHNSPGDNGWGQRGGLGGVVFPGRWYCIETEVKLNSIDTSNPSVNFQPDGLLRTWIDGRLVYENTGMVFRTWPVATGPYNPIGLRPIRELGVAWLLWNWYNGGTTQSSVQRTSFTTGVVWAKKRIGPMKMP